MSSTTTVSTISPSDPHQHMEESFDLTWNDILYEGGLGTWTPRSSIRWLMISVCAIGVLGKIIILINKYPYIILFRQCTRCLYVTPSKNANSIDICLPNSIMFIKYCDIIISNYF
jgi:hypothetical protein